MRYPLRVVFDFMPVGLVVRIATCPYLAGKGQNGSRISWGDMGATHFQMRKLAKVASEMALHVLAYNMKRVIQILGVDGLMAALRA